LIDVNKSSEVQKATILIILTGALEIYLGYQSIQLSLIFSNFIQAVFGAIMPVFGLLTLCASLIVWLQNSWATRIITFLGVAVCATLIIFGFYLIAIVLFTPLYWVAINWIRTSPSREISDWHDD
jgi:hypothetical protein